VRPKMLAMNVGNIVGMSPRVNDVRSCSIYKALRAMKEACIEFPFETPTSKQKETCLMCDQLYKPNQKSLEKHGSAMDRRRFPVAGVGGALGYSRGPLWQPQRPSRKPR
jgi:hypothetical protein